MNSDWKSSSLSQSSFLQEAMRILDESGTRICLVVDKDNSLLGTVTDGDVRRGLLKNLTLNTPVFEIMNRNPITASLDMSYEEIQMLLLKKSIVAVPVIDQSRKVLKLEFVSELQKNEYSHIPVLIMAGGFGKRLGKLTVELPKPMLAVGSKPVIEHIIDRLFQQGLKKFFISTFYKADNIRNYFKDGRQKKIEIEYLEEEYPLGTAGCLYLLKGKVNNTFLVVNGDLLVRFNFSNLIKFHEKNKSFVTICIRQSCYEVPYGVVKLDQINVLEILEKPQYIHNVNAGIYCFSYQALEYVLEETPIDMPALLQKIIKSGKKIHAFPLHEDWIDIGTAETLNKAKKEYA